MKTSKRLREIKHKSTDTNNYPSKKGKKRYLLSRNGGQHSTNDQTLLSYFAFFFACLFSLVSGNVSHETGQLATDENFESTCETLLPECKCFDYEMVKGLVCVNVNDFGVFTKTLGNESLFEEGTTYEISLSGTRVLPRQFLMGLTVYRLFIDDTEMEGLEEGAFDGVRLRRFHVWNSSIKKIPDFQPIRDFLREVNLDNSLLISVEGDHLKNLTLLEKLSFVNNSIEFVAPDAFEGTENVLFFDISHNYLQFLPPTLFDPWKKLKKVVLSNNQLLHVIRLFAVTHPQFIYLDHNNLTDLDSVLHPNMSQVERVSLSYNPISKVTNNSFNGKLVNTRQLFLDHCQIQEFNAMHYSDLQSLLTLDLSYNHIEMVANPMIDFGNKLELDFTGNRIREFSARLKYTVERLHLDKNLITKLGRTLRLGQLTLITIADNQIQELNKEDFLGLHRVVLLDLQGNLISIIERDSFQALNRDLLYLDLSRNKIRKLNGSVRFLSLLLSLNLTDNQIESFESGEFQGLNELTDLFLKGNRLKTLGQEIQGLSRLAKLVISNNMIRTIKKDQLPVGLQYMYVDGNALACDCQILSFLQHLNSTSKLKTDVSLCMPSNNSSLIPSARCPDGCQCVCTNNADDHYISVNCSSIGMTELPPIFAASTPAEFHSSSLVVFLPRNMKQNDLLSENVPFYIQDDIKSVDFSHNNLRSVVDARFPEGIENLRLDHNVLQQPPSSLLYSLKTLSRVTLSGNPWVCDCGTLDFERWILTHSNFIFDVNVTRCGSDNEVRSGLANKAIWTLTDIDLCPPNSGIYISLVISILGCSLIVFIVIIIWIRYKVNIKAWLYAQGVTWIKERDTDEGKAYDALISFNYNDENLVIPELINVIEKQAPNIRLIVPNRDIPTGHGDTLGNFILEIQRSKRTVIFLTRNFLFSELSMFEFNAAHIQPLKDPKHKIIIVKLGVNLPKESEMLEAVQMYPKRYVCLKWESKFFWNNLLYHLPTSSSQRPNTMDSVDQKISVVV